MHVKHFIDSSFESLKAQIFSGDTWAHRVGFKELGKTPGLFLTTSIKRVNV